MASLHLNKTENDIFSGYSKLETPEGRIEHKVEGSLLPKGFEELIKEYEKAFASKVTTWNYILDEHNISSIKTKAILSPEQIQNFLQATRKYEEHKRYSPNTGLFITRLIQNSHDAGDNLFKLETRTLSKRIHFLGYNLQGKGNNLLEIIVDGNAGDSCGLRAKNLRKLYIQGDVGDDCSKCATNIDGIFIAGYCGEWCGYGAENIREFYLNGNVNVFGCGSKTKNSTFKTPNQETLQLLKKNVPTDKGNKIYFIKENSEEKRIWRLRDFLWI
ncbi:MAG: hypothetical protein ABIB71_06900 [Candidatus Woesearchaeota archaeon]